MFSMDGPNLQYHGWIAKKRHCRITNVNTMWTLFFRLKHCSKYNLHNQKMTNFAWYSADCCNNMIFWQTTRTSTCYGTYYTADLVSLASLDWLQWKQMLNQYDGTVRWWVATEQRCCLDVVSWDWYSVSRQILRSPYCPVSSHTYMSGQWSLAHVSCIGPCVYDVL